MEEILASIRKIISEDSPEPHAMESSPPSGANEAQEPGVLELTQEAHDEHGVQPASGTWPPLPSESVHSDDRIEGAWRESAHVAATADESRASRPGDGIFSDKSRKALDDALTQLAPQGTGEAISGSPAPVGGLPLEAVFERAVGEAFGPVLRQTPGGSIHSPCPTNPGRNSGRQIARVCGPSPVSRQRRPWCRRRIGFSWVSQGFGLSNTTPWG